MFLKLLEVIPQHVVDQPIVVAILCLVTDFNDWL